LNVSKLRYGIRKAFPLANRYSSFLGSSLEMNAPLLLTTFRRS